VIFAKGRIVERVRKADLKEKLMKWVKEYSSKNKRA